MPLKALRSHLNSTVFQKSFIHTTRFGSHRIISLLSVCAFVRVGDIKKEVLLVVLLVKGSHGGRGGRECVVDEEEECVLRPEADPLPDEEVKLADGQVGGDEVLLLVEVAQPRLGGLLHDHGHAVGVFSPDFLPLRPPLLEGVLLLVGPLHAGHLVLRRREQGQLWYV